MYLCVEFVSNLFDFTMFYACFILTPNGPFGWSWVQDPIDPAPIFRVCFQFMRPSESEFDFGSKNNKWF